MAFLEVLTRTYKRPSLLEKNVASLASQSDKDYEQTFLVDHIGCGVIWSHENMADYGPKLTGEYIWILDDDDRCIRPTLVEELKAIVKEHKPDVIMVRMDHKERGYLPPYGHWGHWPEKGQVGMSAFIVKRSLWQLCSDGFRTGENEADYYFIKNVFEVARLVYWHDVIASEVMQFGYGEPE